MSGHGDSDHVRRGFRAVRVHGVGAFVERPGGGHSRPESCPSLGRHGIGISAAAGFGGGGLVGIALHDEGGPLVLVGAGNSLREALKLLGWHV